MSAGKCPNLKRFDPITVLQNLQLLLGGVSKDDESERYHLEWDGLCKWAKENGALYTGDIGNLLLQLKQSSGIPYIKNNVVQWDGSGHEHDVIIIPPYYYKKTKWNCAGYTFDPKTKMVTLASVREYLIRLVLHNTFFNTDIEILGVIINENNRSILIRQKIISGDIPSSIEEMDELFANNIRVKK